MKRLGDKANRLFVYMKLEARGKREFAMPYTKIMKVMPISRPTIKTTIEELERAGFIDILERNGNVRKPNLYAFSTRWREMEKKCKSAVKPFYQSKAKLVKPFYQ